MIGYTLTITDSGQTTYTGITVIRVVRPDIRRRGLQRRRDREHRHAVLHQPRTLTWTGSLAPGASATVTFTVTVNNPDTGDKLVIITATSSAPGSACPAGTTAAPCRSTLVVLAPGLTIAATAGGTTAVPGATVHYTVTITDSGQTTYSAHYRHRRPDRAAGRRRLQRRRGATAGAVSYTSPDLTWTGSLAPGAAATVTFSVTVNNPDTGNRSLATLITSTAAGNNCPAGSTDPNCATSVPVESAALLTMTISSDAASAVAGGVVHYTVTVTNAAVIPYAGATFTDDLSGLLDDAAYNGNAAATVGAVTYTSPDLTWTGTVPANGTATITYTVTVNNPDTGNKTLTSALTSASLGGNCPSGGTDPACSSTVTVSQLVINSTANVTSATPGAVVAYTTTLTNTGQTPYFGITMTADGAGLAADATGNGDEAASSGTLSEGGTGAVWTGDIPVGATVTLTGSITVNNPDTGTHVLTEINVSNAQGSNCPTGSTDPRCGTSIPVLIPALTITNTPSTNPATPGATIGYTLTITDSGQTSYTGITVTEDLSGMVGDAAYNNDAIASTGTLSYTSPTLTWTGSLAAGASATVTFSVTVNNPDTGDKLVIVTGTSAAPGSACPAGTTAAPCRSTVVVLTPGLDIAATAGSASTVAGGTVHYTVTITDTGQTPYTGITVTDDLTGLLDDAVYNGDGSATAGTVSYTSPDLTWTGSLAVGAAATVTFTATANNPPTGDRILTTLITSAAAGNNCPVGSTDPACATSVQEAVLTMTNSASTTTTTPGSVVGYTVTVTNSGQVPVTGSTLTVPLSGVLDDAAFNNDAGTTEGLVSFTSPNLIWTGDLSPGQSATITFSVTVNNPDTGNKTLADTLTSTTPGSNCPASGTAPAACSTSVTVLIPALTITKTANVSTTTPGSTVDYTITVDDTGQTPYTGATVTDDLTGVLDDMTFDGDAAATTGTVSYTSPTLTWTGNLNPGDTATITYSVTVHNPDLGDKLPVNTAVSADPGSTCPPSAPAPACTATVTVLIPALTITKTANTATTTPGSVVQYTITVADTGQTPYSGAVVTDDLTDVLDDAAYNGDASATAGTVSYTSPELTWTGNLSTGGTATITYSVTVSNPDTGNDLLVNTVTSAAPGSTCPVSGTGGSACSVTVGVIAGPLTITAPVNADPRLDGSRRLGRAPASARSRSPTTGGSAPTGPPPSPPRGSPPAAAHRPRRSRPATPPTPSPASAAPRARPPSPMPPR